MTRDNGISEILRKNFFNKTTLQTKSYTPSPGARIHRSKVAAVSVDCGAVMFNNASVAVAQARENLLQPLVRDHLPAVLHRLLNRVVR